MQRKKSQTFLQGAFVLVVATLVVKLIGALFKIPLQWLIGDDGMGIFNVAYQFYSTMLVVSTAGVPAALSKMVAESVARGREKEARHVVRLAAVVFIALGAVCAVVLFAGAHFITELIGNPLVYESIRTIAPSVFFVAVIAVIRGYYQGLSDMVPTGVSQIIEAAGKLVFGLALGAWAMHLGMDLTRCTAMVILGITISEAIAMLLLMVYMAWGQKNPRKGLSDQCEPSSKLLGQLMWIVVPITLTSSVTSLTSLIDSVMIVGRLQEIGYSLQEANLLFGMYTGKAMTMFNLPQNIVTAVATAILPAIAGAYASARFGQASETMGSAMRITMLISLPCFAGYFVLAEPIIGMLFTGDYEISGQMLRILAVAIPPIGMVSLTNSILQAIGDVRIPLLSMLAGSVLKVILNHWLVAVPAVGVYGASVGTLACYTLIAVINLVCLGRRIRLPDAGRLLVRPLAACAGLAAVALIVYRIVGTISSSLGVLAAICAGGVTYVILLLVLKALAKEDILLLPKGDKLVKLLKME